MARYVGLDGFRGGWVAAWIDERGNHGFGYATRIEPLLSSAYDQAMIDMPIGLKRSGQRLCDISARKLMGASVFLGARRNLWDFPDQASANRYYWHHEGRGAGVSCQLWNIRNKIREVDDFITPERQKTVRETHPELIFWSLNGRVHLARKKSASGREQRIGLLDQHGFHEVRRWLAQRRGTGIGHDDLIDACACAIAAREANAFFGAGETDERGLRMEINYCE